MPAKTRKQSHGGARPGSGPKKRIDGKRVGFYLDDPTRSTMRDLGEGNLSEGIRRAGKIIARIGVVGCFLLLENKDLGIEVEES